MRHNAIYFLAAITVGLLNYLYYPILGRLLDPIPFGEVQILVSLFLQATVYLTVMGLVTVHIVANRDDARQANRIVSELEKSALLVSIAVLLLTVIFNAQIKQYFHFDSAWPFILLGIAIVITVPYLFRSAYVNGKKLFSLNALSSITAALGKLVFSVGFVLLGFSTGGAIFGIILAQLIAFWLAAYFAKKHGFVDAVQKKIRWPDVRLIAPELKYALLVLTGSLAITIMYSVDIIIVKHYFDAYTAGLYAGVSTVARILFFLTVSISQVMMPSIRLNHPPAQNQRILFRSLLLVMVIGGGVLGLMWLFPRFVIERLMGGEYVTHADLLPRLGLMVYFVSILNVFVTYYMALRQYWIMAMALITVGAVFFLMQINHDQLAAVVDNLLYGSLLMAGLLIARSSFRYVKPA